MERSLLATKLHVPPQSPRERVVPRPRLIEQLNAGLHGRLTLISAPAGYGKTTLLSEWINSQVGSREYGVWGRNAKREAANIREPGSEQRITDTSSPTSNSLLPTPYSLLPPTSRCAWLSLDEGENDWARFLAYVIAALQTIDESIGEGILRALQSPRSPPVEDLLTTLINQISIISDHFLLILDDYHIIAAQPVHDALTFLLDHLPTITCRDGQCQGMHMVIATRGDLPLPLARLRGRGELNELRQADLRFTPDETAEFLEQTPGLKLTAEDIAALASRTEGWITGLQMAAVSMRGQDADRIADFIRAFTGSNRYVLDYLVEEVLAGQPKRIHSFLLQTSILDRLTGPLCDAILGRGEKEQESRGETGLTSTPPLPCSPAPQIPSFSAFGQEILEYLERTNLFIVPLDEQREWYRYHRLFAELLRRQLEEQVGAGGVALLHRRASAWYEEHGFTEAAIDHALSAGEFERAADLVEGAAEATLMRSEIATFLNWMEKLPEDLVRARPRLSVLHAGALMLSGHPLDVVESRLQDAMEGDPAGQLAGEAAAFRALMATLTGDARHSTKLSQQALKLLPEESPWRSIVADNLGMAYVLSGDIDAATHTFEEAARIGHKAGDVFSAVAALCNVAGLCVARGQLRRASAIYQRALELSTDQQGRQLPIAGKALLGLGELSREWNDLEGATRYLTHSIELTRLYGEMGVIVGYITLARVKQAQGDVDGAWEMVHKAQLMAHKVDVTEMDDILVAAYQARLWVAQGNLETATRWVQERGLTAEEMEEDAASSHEFREIDNITLVRVYLAQGRADEALEVLRSRQETAERLGRTRRVIEILNLQALARQEQGNTKDALATLGRALSLAEPEGYVRIFVDEGEPMVRLLRQAASHGITPDYVAKLMAAFEPETKDEGQTTEDERRRTAEVFSSSVLRPSSLATSEVTGLIEPLSNYKRITSEYCPDSNRGKSELISLQALSERELEILRLLTTHLSSTEIAEQLCISANTVRFHIKNIYSKLQVHRRSDAIHRAEELGLL